MKNKPKQLCKKLQILLNNKLNKKKNKEEYKEDKSIQFFCSDCKHLKILLNKKLNKKKNIKEIFNKLNNPTEKDIETKLCNLRGNKKFKSVFD